ncbi:GNAT family N-acetyltransferase [Jannaschia rubra]|uniref:Acetyltransferase (GNAT) family protein n=1 Tax=Jannaschia rubra TaxID=282197 RepID=A0A0M6XN36_9RHOB|nr:GNAT family N-acetyltransferase [Jannaschia rubra]CTQ32600.1 Acetyltransferase (GNAT) family protein [Jannaschia rubra]SFF85783.1 Acetyltransferase (GNAT) family protein [Jannaschia rubra]
MTDWLGVIDACWPAERTVTAGPWRLRVTPGGGGRVNAISGDGDDIDLAERTARDLGQRPSFIVLPGQDRLDAALAERGYGITDAVDILTIPVTTLAVGVMPYATAFTIWPPLQIMRDIWAEGGHVGSVRQAVMMRAARPAGILARVDDRAAGAAFVAAHGHVALLSAVEVLARHRRKGLAGTILTAAAHWARAQGCTEVALVVERGNVPARTAYASHGMKCVAGYHYRRPPEEP